MNQGEAESWGSADSFLHVVAPDVFVVDTLVVVDIVFVLLLFNIFFILALLVSCIVLGIIFLYPYENFCSCYF